MRTVRRVTKRGLLRAVAVLALAGFVVGGLAQLRMETSLASFLPADDPVVEGLDDVGKSFGGDPVVVLVEGKQPRQQFDEQHLMPLLGLEGRLSQLPDVATVYGPATVLNQIAGHTQDLLAELSGRRDGLRNKAVSDAKRDGAPAGAADQAGERAVRKFDARYGSLIVQGLPAGLPTLRNTQFVSSVVFASNGQPKPQWHFIVPKADTVAVLVRPRQGLNEQATQGLVDSVHRAVDDAGLDARRVTVSGAPVVAGGLSAEIKREIPLIGGLAVLAVGACFLLAPWAPIRRRLLPVATTLIAVATTVALFGWVGRPVSLGVVAFLSVLLGIGSYYPTYLALRARRRVVLVVVAATAASFATLALSPLPFVRDLGVTLAVGVLFAAGIGAALLSWIGRDETVGAADPGPAEAPRASPRSVRVAALTGALAVAAAGWLALPGLPIEGSFHRFADGLPELNDAKRVESVVGSSAELDVVLRGDNVLSPEAYAWARNAHDRAIATHGDELRSVLSPSRLLPFLGAKPTGEEIAAGARLMPPYLTSAVFRSDNKVALLTFGVRLDDVGGLRALRDDLASSLPPPPPGYHAELTGLSMAAVRGNELVADSRFIGNLAGIAAAGAVLALGLRRRADAVRGVLAAVTATGTGLAVLGALGVPLSPITVALGSLTAAVACEFTVVLAESRRRGNAALRRSVQLAMATSAAGYAVLAASELPAIREFGMVLAGSVVLSMASALIVTWATVTRTVQRPMSHPQVTATELAEVGTA